jgi:PAS domain S-box-containing protein
MQCHCNFPNPLSEVIDSHPVTVPPQTTLLEAIALMHQTCVDCLLITDHHQLVGMFTEREVFRAITASQPLTDVISTAAKPPVFILEAELRGFEVQGLYTIVELLEHHQVRHLPVVDRSGLIVGLIGQERVLHALKQYLEPLPTEWTTVEAAHDDRLLSNIARNWQQWETQHTLLANVVEHTGDSIEITDTDHRIEYVNPAFERMMGYERSEVIGKTSAELFCTNADDIACYQAIELSLERRQTWHGPLIAKRKDGSLCYLEAAFFPLSDAEETITHYVAVKRDVTPCTRMAEALRQSKAQFEALVANVPGMIYQHVLYPDGSYIFPYVSSACKEIYELAPEAVMQQMNPFWDLIHPDDRSSVLETIHLSATTLESRRLEYRIITPSGQTKWVQGTSRPSRQADGSVVWDGIVVDITASKETEFALRQSEENLRLVLQNMPVMLDAFDLDQNLIVWNHECERVTGYSADEMIGRPNGMELLYPDSAYREQILNKEQREGGDYRNQEWTLMTKDQCPRTIAWSNISSQFPIPGWATWGIGVDVTERKQAEIALRQSEEMFRRIFDAAPIGIVLADLEGQLIRVNQAYCQLLGYDEDELTQMTFREIIHPEDVETEIQFTEIPSGHSPCVQVEKRFINKSGESLWITLISAYICDPDNRPIYSIGMVEDITERKQAEANTLTALERERELNELKSRFISIVSHEFRTPLSTILSSIELLQKYGQQWTIEKQQTHYQRTIQAVHRMIQLLNDVLVIGTVEAGKLQFNPSPIDLVYFCHELLDELQLSLGTHHTLLFTHSGHLQSPCLDAQLLHHILSNLLSNAIKYSPQGREIHLKLACFPQAVLFQIEDQGIGIALEDQDQIFNIFQRGSNVGTISGTGLGLAIVKQCVELHNGSIEFMSHPEKGTTFTVKLPCIVHPSNEN